MGESLTYGKRVILHNKIKCNRCGEIIESYDVHDFKWCKCKTVFVDGGHEYLRRGFKNSPNDFTDLSEHVNINSCGVNTNIKYNILSTEKMKELKFMLSSDKWVMYHLLRRPKEFGKNINISLHISLPLNYNYDELDIKVIDEDYLQPYDYQYLIEMAERENKTNDVAIAVRDEVEDIIARLQRAKVLSGHNRGDYI